MDEIFLPFSIICQVMSMNNSNLHYVVIYSYLMGVDAIDQIIIPQYIFSI